MLLNFVCCNVDSYYPMEYVEILRDQVLRNCTAMEHEVAFWCITDRPDDLPAGVYPIPHDRAFPGWWSKLQLFAPHMPWNEGDRVIYFDLDVCITGRLEDFVERDGIIKDWHWPGINNTSVMAWKHGQHRGVWDHWDPAFMELSPGPIVPKHLLPAGAKNSGDQEFIAYAALQGWDTDPWETYPPEWFRSYRDCHVWPPSGCKGVIMHGRPKNHEITTGWVPNVWKVGGFTSLPEFKGVNTSEDDRLANVAANSRRDLPWFTGFSDEGKTIAIVCGAPSMRQSLPEIKAQKRRGTRIVSVNNAWRFLVANGVTPDVHVMLDARPQNAEFLVGMPRSVRVLLASQCHPDVFDTAEAEGLDVVLWHNGYDAGNEKLREILDPWWADGPNQKPCILVPGGSTVGLRSLWLAAFSGFRTVHLYGIDGCYADDGSHHAYAQALNDGETVLDIVRGPKTYRCAPWMLRQANEFEATWRELQAFQFEPGVPSPVTVHVHGVGLVPDIARDLRAEARAA